MCDVTRLYLGDELILQSALNSRFGLIWINFGSNQESKGSIRKIIEFIMRWAVDAWMDYGRTDGRVDEPTDKPM